ncbi:hypothetical protein MSAN_02399900 [Mycena sanguinolenta]|uniref:Uncharacterized protein n=1 Tax=Mycena sanguinolenta TaxID=230812 RepID=A0A8H6X3W6_9AGAR|nr:hypothetical protein MSAN_02399900 [Mycena sanguinolenta]
MNPDYIFEHDASDFDIGLKSLLCWLKKVPSVPQDLIKLWEDYAYMFALQKTLLGGQWEGDINPLMSGNFAVPPSTEFLQTLVPLALFPTELWNLRHRLGLTWTELRTFICGPCSNIAQDKCPLPALDIRLSCRDAALRYIRTMVKNHVDAGGEVYPWESRKILVALESIRKMGNPMNSSDRANDMERYDIGYGIAHLVRLSPPCPVLYRELLSIPWSCIEPSGELLIHHVCNGSR